MNPHKELQRIETFSDGVFAIACTLLVIEIAAPHVDDVMRPAALWLALRRVWPSFLAYLLGFETIFIAWAAHHRALNLLAKSSKALLYANGLLLLSITFIPFPTAVLAQYINTPQANIPVMFYSATSVVTNLSFEVWWLTMFRPVRLFSETVSRGGDEAAFTSFGKVDVYANGFEVESVLPGGDTLRLSGTSMAAPQVVNLAAKLLAVYPRLDTAAVKKLIVEGADTKIVTGGRSIRLLNESRSFELAESLSKSSAR